MANKFFKSTDIKVYPSSKRVDYHDRNARLNSEQNLVSVVNRLTNRNSFVIDGLTIDPTGTTLKSGSCNIHGYLFNLQFDNDISDIKGDFSNNSYLYLKIKTQENTINSPSMQTKYVELVSLDTQLIKDESGIDSIAGVLDGSTSANSTFTGIQLVTGPDYSNTNYCINDADDNIKEWYLPIAKWDTTWKNLISDDSIEDSNTSRWNTLKVDADTIRIAAKENTVSNKYYAKQQNLSTWLQYNFIIDDGEID